MEVASKAFIVMGRILKASYDELFLCVFMSIAWWIGTILIIPAASVTQAMHHVANRMANYQRVNNGFFWDVLWKNFGRSWLLYLFHLLMPAAVLMNIWFYINGQNSWMRIIGIAWLWIMILAMMMMQYFFPLFWQQDEPSLKLVLRNSFLLAVRYPLYTFLMLIFHSVFLLLSIGLTLPLILLAPAVLAIGANFAAAGILQEMDLAPQPPVITK